MLEELTGEANLVRCALENMPADIVPFCGRFPAGTCDYASKLLIKYLWDKGYTDLHYVSGEIGVRDGTTAGWFSGHAWVEIDEYAIDITADQFNGRVGLSVSFPAVLVTKDKYSHRRHFIFERDLIEVYDSLRTSETVSYFVTSYPDALRHVMNYKGKIANQL